MRIAIRGIGWVTVAGMGGGREGTAFAMPGGDLPPIKRRQVFAEPDQRFGRLDPYAKAGLAAITFALRDAGLESWREKRPIGIVAATVCGCLETDLAYYATVVPQGGALASPNLFAYTLPNSFLGEAAIRFGLTGPTFVVADGAAAGTVALSVACELIAAGECATILAGLCDVPPFGWPAGFGPAVSPGAIFFFIGTGDGQSPSPYGVLRLGAGGEIGYNGREVVSLETLAAACTGRQRKQEREP